MLNRFNINANGFTAWRVKRRGACWSLTSYKNVQHSTSPRGVVEANTLVVSLNSVSQCWKLLVTKFTLTHTAGWQKTNFSQPALTEYTTRCLCGVYTVNIKSNEHSGEAVGEDADSQVDKALNYSVCPSSEKLYPSSVHHQSPFRCWFLQSKSIIFLLKYQACL